MRTWIEINREALLHNLQEIRKTLPESTLLAPVVKANAYGHGLNEVVKVLAEYSQFFCVDSFDEARQVKELAPHSRVLIMGYQELETLDFEDWLQGMEIVVFDKHSLTFLQKKAREREIRIGVHLKVETGLNRLGMSEFDVHESAAILTDCENLELSGIYTHYANVEDTLDPEFYITQHSRFSSVCAPYREKIKSGLLIHSCASAAALLHPEASSSLARIGIAMYGCYSSWQTLLSMREKNNPFVELKPVMSVKTRVAQIKEVKKGETVGYGCTHRVLRDSRVAVLPVGYYDGYLRCFGARASVLIQGQRAPVIGRVAMNMCMLDVSHLESVSPGEEVVLLGVQGSESIGAQELADWGNTIHYEILTSFKEHLPRVLIEGEGDS